MYYCEARKWAGIQFRGKGRGNSDIMQTEGKRRKQNNNWKNEEHT